MLYLTMLFLSEFGIRNISEQFFSFRGPYFFPSDFDDRAPGVTFVGHVTTLHLFNPDNRQIRVINLDEPFAMVADPADPAVWSECVSELSMRVVAALGVDDVDCSDAHACEIYIYKTYGGSHEKSEVDS